MGVPYCLTAFLLPGMETRWLRAAAIFSQEVTLSLEASVKDGMAQTEKRVLYNFMEPPPAPGGLHPASLTQTEMTHVLFRPLSFPICYEQLNAKPDGSTVK